VTEIRIIFRPPPRLTLAPQFAPHANEFVLRIDPNPGADLVVHAKTPGVQSTESADLSLIFSDELGDAPEPYERLLGDALHGDASLFIREDSVEETWRIVQPLLDSPPPLESYKPGSWEPSGADTLISGSPHWRQPWTHSHAAR
jgi:glucose-6-phosphate 1-dehydrogenase